MEKLSDIIKSGQLTLVDFFATWCGPCKTMHPVLEQLKEELGDSIRIVKVDVDKNEAIAMQMRTTRPLENNAVVIDDEGEVIGTYSKNHLFGDEPKYFTANGEYPVFDTKYGKIGIMICCDNNFPEPARILALGGAELIFMPAAWRVQEEDLWKLLISSHACENNVFIAAANVFSRMDDLFLFGHSAAGQV